MKCMKRMARLALSRSPGRCGLAWSPWVVLLAVCLGGTASVFAQSSFPSGVIDRQGLSWTTGGSRSWDSDSSVKRDVWSGRSGAIGHSQESWVQTTIQGPARISFYWKVSSESGYDYLRFSINGNQIASISGGQDWAESTHEIAGSGSHTIRFTYSKDGSVVSGADCGWVDSFTAFSGEASLVLNGFAGLPYAMAEGAAWTKDSQVSRDGSSMRSGVIGHNEVSSFQIPGVPGNQTVTWYGRTSSESGYDKLRFYVDGSEIGSLVMSGESGWVQKSHPLGGGTHTLKWAYTKDGSVVSGADAAWVDEVSFLYPPVIVIQPTGGSYAVGSTLRLSAEGGGGPGTTFTWKKDGVALANGGRISGASSLALQIAPVAVGDAGSYTLTLANSAGTVVSSAATVTVPVPPSIATHPVGATVVVGGNVTFSVVAGGTGPISYQWRLNGVDISGATSASYTVSGAALSQAGTYTVSVRNAYGSTLSAGAVLVVQGAPSITVQPAAALSLATGQTGLLAVTASSSLQPVTYQWTKGGSNLEDDERITGTTTAQLTLADAALTDSGTYAVVVGNSAGSVTSSSAVVTVTPFNNPPTIDAIAPVSRLEDAAATVVPLAGIGDGNGGTQTLTVTATSSNPTLVPHPGVTYSSPSSTGSLSITSAAGRSGSATVNVRVQDNGGTLGGGVNFVEQQFLVTVAAVNDIPTLNPLGNVTLLDKSLAGGEYTNDFRQGATGGTLLGTAFTSNAGTYNEKLELTPPLPYRQGGFFIDDLTPAHAVTRFTARFRAYAGDGSTPPADGFSFNFMGDNPTGVTLGSAETGVGSGLSVGFRIYTQANNPAFVVLKYNGLQIARTNYQVANIGTRAAMPLIEVSMDSDRKVTVKHNDTVLFDAVQTPCSPAAGWRFGFAARTGGSYAWQLIDDVALSVTCSNPAQSVSLTGITDGGDGGQDLTVTATSSHPALVGPPTVIYTSPFTTGTLSLPLPTPHISGTSTITVRVQDDGGTDNGGVNFVERQFTVTTQPVNDPPTLDALPNLAVLSTVGNQQTVNLTGITDGDGGLQTVSITASSSNTGVIPTPTITYTSGNATGTLWFTPVTSSSGTVTITVTAQDNGGTANGGVNSTIRTFTVKVGPVPPVIDVSPEPQIVLVGQNVTFSVAATGVGLTYKWFKNGAEIAGATGTSLALNNVTAANAATYRVQVFNANTELIYPYADAILTVVQPPLKIAVLPTQEAAFTNIVTSPGAFSIQWLKDGEDITGATASTFVIPAAQTVDAAGYSVRVTVGSKTLITPAVTMRLIGEISSLFNTGVGNNGWRLDDRAEDSHYELIAPSPILGQPVAVVTSGTYPIPPWVAGGTNSAWISPTTRLREAGSAAGSNYVYRTTFDLTGMELESVRLEGQFAADDTITEVRLNGVSVLTPTGVASNAFQSFNLSFLTHGTEADDQFALRGQLGDAADVAGTGNNVGATSETGEPLAVSSTYHGTVNSVWWRWTAPSSGTVTVDSSGTTVSSILAVFSGSAVQALTLLGSDFGNGLWTQQIRTVIFEAVAGTEYQIYMDGYQDFTGDLKVNLHLVPTGPAGSDMFASRGSLNVAGASWNVKATGSNVGTTGETGETAAGTLNTVWWKWTAPASGTVTIDTLGSGFDTYLKVYTGSVLSSLSSIAANDDYQGTYQSGVQVNTVGGTEYQIQVDGYGDIVGAIVLNVVWGTIPAAGPAEGVPHILAGLNTLDFVVKNTADDGLDRSLTGLRVEFTGSQAVPNPVEITTQPEGGMVVYGDRKIFSVGVVSGSPVTYQWYKDNQAIEGATESSLVYNRTDDDDAGSYTVKVTNLNGIRWSDPVVLLVDVPLTITTHPADVAVPLGGTAELAVRFRGNPPLTVQWQRNGVDILDATNATLTLPSVTVAQAGRYLAVVGDRDDSLESEEAVLTVVEPPMIVQEPRDFNGVAGRDTLQLEALVDGSAPLRHRWFLNDIPLAAANSATLNLGRLRETQEGGYRLIVTNLAGAVTSRLAQVTVVVPPAITNASGNVKVYEGETANLAVNAIGSGTLEYEWYKGGTLVVGETSSSLTLTNLLRGHGGEFAVVVSSPYGRVTNSFRLDVYTPPVPVVSTGLDMVQEFTLQPGWNAIFLNVQPEDNTTEAVFGDLPFSSIWRWADPRTGPQFIADQSEATLDTAHWQIYLPTNRVESFQNNLVRVFRHSAYLIRLDTNAPVTLTVVGEPGYQRQHWASDAYTLTGFPVSPDDAPTVGDFFKASAAHYDTASGQIRAMYRLQPDGIWMPVEATNTLAFGEAYWVYTKGASDYLAPIEASFQGLYAMTYGVGADTKELTVHFRDPGDAATGMATALFSHFDPDQSLPLAINEFDPLQGGEWRDLPNDYSVSFQSLSTHTVRLAAKRDRIPDLLYEGLMTIWGRGTRHVIPLTVERDEPDVGAAPGQPFNPVGLWLGNVSITHVSEVNGLTTNYVVTLITNIVNGVTNVVEEPTTEVRNVTVGSLPTPVKDPFELRMILHADTNGVCRLLQQVTLLTTEAQQTVSNGIVTETTGGDPVLVSDPSLIPNYKGVALRGRETVGRRFSTPFYPMYNTNSVPFDGELGLGRSLSATWALPASAPLNPFYHKYHPDHDNLDARFKVFQEEAYIVRRTVTLIVPARQGSTTRPGMGQDEIQGTYRETVQGLHRTPITVEGDFQIKRILPVGALNPMTN